MKRVVLGMASIVLASGLLAGCAQSTDEPTASSGAASSSDNSGLPSISVPVLMGAASSEVASSELASSELASSEVASSETASSELASSETASSELGSTGTVVAGPSGIGQMNVPMNYISPADLRTRMEAGGKDLLIVDLRKLSDSNGAHLEHSVFAPMNKAVDNNDYSDAIANMSSALYDATGSEVGEGKTIVLVCYAGKKYAQAGTDVLNALGADMDSVFTLEGGFTAWSEGQNPVVSD